MDNGELGSKSVLFTQKDILLFGCRQCYKNQIQNTISSESTSISTSVFFYSQCALVQTDIYSNSNCTFIALNLYLMIDSKMQKAKIRDRNR